MSVLKFAALPVLFIGLFACKGDPKPPSQAEKQPERWKRGTGWVLTQCQKESDAFRWVCGRRSDDDKPIPIAPTEGAIFRSPPARGLPARSDAPRDSDSAYDETLRRLADVKNIKPGSFKLTQTKTERVVNESNGPGNFPVHYTFTQVEFEELETP